MFGSPVAGFRIFPEMLSGGFCHKSGFLYMAKDCRMSYN